MGDEAEGESEFETIFSATDCHVNGPSGVFPVGICRKSRNFDFPSPLNLVGSVAGQGSSSDWLSAEKLDFFHPATTFTFHSSSTFCSISHLHPTHFNHLFSPLIWHRIVDSLSAGVAKSITYFLWFLSLYSLTIPQRWHPAEKMARSSSPRRSSWGTALEQST